MNGMYQFLWSSALYVTFIGFILIVIRRVMNRLNCQQTSIYQLWYIFPMGFLMLLFFQFTNIKVNAISGLHILELPVIKSSPLIQNSSLSLTTLVLLTWIFIALGLVFKLIYQYFRFKRSLHSEIRIISHQIRKSALATGPLAFGLLSPKVYLPLDNSSKFNQHQQNMLVEHELNHCLRYDPLMRIFYKFLECVFWFHPIMYVLNKKMKYDQESSVDQLVLNQTENKNLKIEYSKLLYQISQNTQMLKKTELSELYCSSNSMLKERIMLIKNTKPNNPQLKSKVITVALISLALASTVVTTTTLANNSDRSASDLNYIPQPPKVNIAANPVQSAKPPLPPKFPVATKSIKSTKLATDIKIIPIVRPAPYYPRKAATDKISGYVTMDIDISTSGLVEDVRVVDSQPEGVFDVEAVKSVKKYEFAPIAQAVTIQQKVQFKLD